MRGGNTTASVLRAITGTVAALALAACPGVQSALDARGPGAAQIAALWWLLLGVATAVYVIVLAALVGAVVRRRDTRDRGDEADTRRRHPGRWIVAVGVAVPTAILAAVFAVTLRTQAALDRPSAADLTVRVIARMWWWEIRYRGLTAADEVITANELHIPVGRRVRLELTSTDVIHSLWVPNLQGKTDLVPGKTTLTWLRADRPGISRGQCAEYCGLQHTRMGLLVIAEGEAEFARWLAAQRQPAAVSADETSRHGQRTFLASGCGYCHSVRGTSTLGLIGPDLTHIASRRSIAAATLPNTRGPLTAWIADPQQFKPGNKMPRMPLTPEDLRAVVTYLESLR